MNIVISSPKDLVLNKQGVCEMLKCSMPTLKRLMSREDFPKCFRLDDAFNSASLWRLSDVQAWVDKRVAAAK